MDLVNTIIQNQMLQALTLLAIVCAVVDTLVGILAAIKSGQFEWGKIAQWVGTHVLGRVIPIVGLAFLAASLGAVTASTDALKALVLTASGAAWAAGLAYAAETVASLNDSRKEASV